MGLLDIFNKKKAPSPPVAAPKHKVLVVDDDQFLREFYQELLTGSGYQVLTANNGQEALVAALNKPDVILLDIMMPVMDGNEVLRQLSQNPQTKEIPVIILTNAGSINNMDHAKIYSAYKFLIKTNVTPEEVLSEVKDAVLRVKKVVIPTIEKQSTSQ
jgi:CheY-like chemotaxis protein